MMTRSRPDPSCVPKRLIRRSRAQVLPTIVSMVMLTATACRVFDNDAYRDAEEAAENAQNGHAGTDEGSSTGDAPWTMGVDHCPYPDTRIIRGDVPRTSSRVPLNTLADDIADCGKLTGFDGPDGVVGVELAAGELVHFAASLVTVAGEAAAPVDVGVYLMGSCDPTTCLKRVERCPAGGGEHFAWSSDSQGLFYFGFDTKAYDQTLIDPEMTITVTFPLCGDRVVDPGETCDDGNLDALDGCDQECHAEITNKGGLVPVEVEPNNYYASGNVLVAPIGETVRLKGHIGGSCDLDFYFLDIPDGGFARARLLGEDGSECPAGSPKIVLEFDDPSGTAELGKAKIPAENGGTNHCPEWDESSFASTALPAGRYVIEMKPPAKGVDMDPFPYILEVVVTPPASGG
ncbi:MAG: DUF4215 domain-containing protein [Nannocystaceae bacterium]